MIHPDAGYFFGIGAFETIAVEHGTPVLLEEHLQRLMRAADFFSIPLSIEDIRNEIYHALAAPEMAAGRRVLKITVSPENLLITTRENTYTDRDYAQGFTVAFSSVRRNETSPLTFHKTLNYGDCLLEKHAAKAHGIQEPLFLNTAGAIAEGATTNLFFVKNEKLYTPSIECGLLPGILRGYLCQRYEVTERPIYPQEIPEFDEMFLTNSLLGIMPVTGFAEALQPSSGASQPFSCAAGPASAHRSSVQYGTASDHRFSAQYGTASDHHSSAQCEAVSGYRFSSRSVADRLLESYKQFCR